MEIQRACYSRKAVEECRVRVRWTTRTVRIKAQHCSKCYEIEKLFDFCYDKTGCCLFDTRNSPWDDYRKLTNLAYETRRETRVVVTKKQLDDALRACLRFLEREINDIIKMMDDGEVDVVA